MNQQNFDQEIIQTLELCLTKMSQKLKSGFEPHEKHSIQLLQQFRSTISTYHTCLKRVGKFLNQFTQPKKNAHDESNNHKQNEKCSHIKQDTINQEVSHSQKQQNIKAPYHSPLFGRKKENPPASPTNQPSGLLCYP